MLKLCCISDTHGNHEELDLSHYPADVLIHAGDFTARDTKTQIIQFLEWFSSQNYKHLILIAGNHERLIESDPKWFTSTLTTFPVITYLQDSEIIIDGIKFYGSPYSNEFCGWAFMEEEPALSKVWDKIPDDTHILVTHSPAYGCHDLVKRAYGSDPHVGSKSLHYKKLSLQGTLKAHISGHIHEGYGISTTADITNVCASMLNEHYKLVNEPITLEI
ncbi:MAG: metallophosphoesterase [Candidatus Thorarchaeota archaeon]|nr:MAG: metallophosphoesterase [Candidatus Thorarchaeota archaeon]